MKYDPITLQRIEEGRLLLDVDDVLVQAQRALTSHVALYGEDAAKAAAEVTIKLKLSVASVEDNTYRVTSGVSVKLPGRPSVSTAAVGDDTERGPSLFCRPTGTTKGNPRQAVLSTRDGRGVAGGEVIDKETGEVKEGPKNGEPRRRKDIDG